jgi:abhydrolase domain-containing protein 10
MSARTTLELRLPHPRGGNLAGRFSYATTPGSFAILYIHGFGSVHHGEKALALEDACARRGWTFAAFDFRGHGASDGSLLGLTGSGLLEDLDVIRAALAERGVERLGPVGSSMGGWAAAWFTRRHPEVVPACVLLAPSFDFPRALWNRLDETQRLLWYQNGRIRVRNEWLDAEVGFGLVEDADRHPLDNLVADWHKPLLIFHGMKDEVIPYTRSVAVVERLNEAAIELRLLNRGDHRLTGLQQQIAEAVCAFFAPWVMSK